MTTIEQLEQDNKNLNSINSNVGDIVVYLESAINELETLSNNIELRYTVDDNATPIITRINKLKDDIETVKIYLKTNVKSSLASNIQSNNNNIVVLKEAEKKAKEEEENKKKSESSSSSSSSSTGYSKPISTPKKSDDSKEKDKWDRW